jgi:hypothetical protein
MTRQDRSDRNSLNLKDDSSLELMRQMRGELADFIGARSG